MKECGQQSVRNVSERDKIVEWMRGNEAAINMILLIAEASQVADDIVDGDAGDNAAAMARLLSIAFVELPSNHFYQANIQQISALFATSIQFWALSDVWGKQDKLKEFGFVYREHLEQIITLCAYIIGGQKHALWVTNDLVNFYRNNEDQDTLEEWVKELIA